MTSRYVRPADQIAAQERTSPIVTALYLVLILLSYALAGASDLQEEQRLSMQGYVEARATVASAADDMPGLEQLDSVRFAQMAIAGECR